MTAPRDIQNPTSFSHADRMFCMLSYCDECLELGPEIITNDNAWIKGAIRYVVALYLGIREILFWLCCEPNNKGLRKIRDFDARNVRKHRRIVDTALIWRSPSSHV